eukprot:15432739-Alexandrium_andersonii.AAC.1
MCIRDSATEIASSVVKELEQLTARFQHAYHGRLDPSVLPIGGGFLPLRLPALSAEESGDIRDTLERCSDALGVLSKESQMTGQALTLDRR